MSNKVQSYAAALCAVAALAAAGTAAQASEPAPASSPADPAVPTDIQVDDGHKLFLTGHATGVQIYECGAGGWNLIAPRADLYGDNGRLIATHFGGPTWEARDGSLVVGRREATVTVDPSAIPWLKLSAASVSAGSDGDRLAGTTYIQRVATTGGVAPAADTCTAATAGTREEVPYTADYHFWKRDGA